MSSLTDAKVNVIQGTYKILHKYFSETVLGSDEYRPVYLAAADSRSDWDNDAANLRMYAAARSPWFSDCFSDD